MNKLDLRSVTQKLYFAKFHQQQLAAVLERDSFVEQKSQALAYRQSVLFHLQTAYVQLLAQIANKYGIGGSLPESLGALQALLEERSLASGEVQRLRLILDAPQSWLLALQSDYQNCFSVVEAGAAYQEASAKGGLVMVSVDDSMPLGEQDIQNIEKYCLQFDELLEEMKVYLDEW